MRKCTECGFPFIIRQSNQARCDKCATKIASILYLEFFADLIGRIARKSDAERAWVLALIRGEVEMAEPGEVDDFNADYDF